MPIREFLNDVPEHIYRQGSLRPEHVCHSVGELIDQLQKLPRDLTVEIDDHPVVLIIPNAMKEHDHVHDEDVFLSFEPAEDYLFTE